MRLTASEVKIRPSHYEPIVYVFSVFPQRVDICQKKSGAQCFNAARVHRMIMEGSFIRKCHRSPFKEPICNDGVFSLHFLHKLFAMPNVTPFHDFECFELQIHLITSQSLEDVSSRD